MLVSSRVTKNYRILKSWHSSNCLQIMLTMALICIASGERSFQ